MFRRSSVVPSRFGDESNYAGGNVKGRPRGSVAQLAECSNGKREALSSSPGRATIFSSPVTFLWLSVGSRLGQRASKSACFVVPPLFRANSGTNLMMQLFLPVAFKIVWICFRINMFDNIFFSFSHKPMKP